MTFVFHTQRCIEVFLYFLRLGATAFGGPAVHIAMMEEDLVRRRAWLEPQRFADLFGTASLLPGPTSTELALLLGRERAGIPGLLLAGYGFIFPAFVMVSVLAAIYIPRDATQAAGAILRGIQPATIVIILQALIPLLRTVLKKWSLWVCAALAVALALVNVNILLILLAAGVSNWILESVRKRGAGVSAAGLLLCFRKLRAAEALPAAGVGLATPALFPLFLVFAKIGAVFYGSGYVLLAFLREEFVERQHWLSEKQLLTAIAVGQFTPGPLFTAATFVGYQLHGFSGACVATAGIFAPAFLYSALSGMLVARVRSSQTAKTILDGVNAASCTLMAVVACQLAASAIVDVKTAVIAAGSAVLLMAIRLNPAWVVLLAGVVGWIWNG